MAFKYIDHTLCCDEISIEEIVKEHGTPLYIYSSEKITSKYQELEDSFKATSLDTKIHFSVKSNSNLSILKFLKNKGSNFDIVSGGELLRLLEIGAKGDQVVFSGVGKTIEEIELAIKNEILMFNVESVSELIAIEKSAKKLKMKANVGLRVNPDVDAATHEYITTGTLESKFGIHLNQAMNVYQQFKNSSHLNFVGLDMHIGSQLIEEKPIKRSLKRYSAFAKTLIEEGFPIKYLDVGGGLGIKYRNEKIITAQKFAKIIEAEFLDPIFKNSTILIEPGRFLVGEAGILVSKLLYVKSYMGKTFYIIDAAMNDLIRPSLYQSYHPIISITDSDEKPILVDVVGPVCESADCFGKNRMLPPLDQNQLIAVMCSGAYGSMMSSNYNTRLKVSEVMVINSKVKLIKKRESLDDLLKLERICLND